MTSWDVVVGRHNSSNALPSASTFLWTIGRGSVLHPARGDIFALTTRTSGYITRSREMTPGGTSVINASFPWLVQTVSTTFDTPNHAPSEWSLARNRPSVRSAVRRLAGRTVDPTARPRATSDVKQ